LRGKRVTVVLTDADVRSVETMIKGTDGDVEEVIVTASSAVVTEAGAPAPPVDPGT
jgi:hypothetical protein